MLTGVRESYNYLAGLTPATKSAAVDGAGGAVVVMVCLDDGSQTTVEELESRWDRCLSRIIELKGTVQVRGILFIFRVREECWAFRISCCYRGRELMLLITDEAGIFAPIVTKVCYQDN